MICEPFDAELAIDCRVGGPFPNAKGPRAVGWGLAPRGVPMDEREGHRLDAGWLESVTETLTERVILPTGDGEVGKTLDGVVLEYAAAHVTHGAFRQE